MINSSEWKEVEDRHENISIRFGKALCFVCLCGASE